MKSWRNTYTFYVWEKITKQMWHTHLYTNRGYRYVYTNKFYKIF